MIPPPTGDLSPLSWTLNLDNVPDTGAFVSRVVRSALWLQLLVLAGTLGYHFIEGWSLLDSLWMVVITISTIGFGEPFPLSEQGRAFTILFILAGVGVAGRLIADLASYASSGGALEGYIYRRRMKELNVLHDHIIVVGYGRLGRQIVAELCRRGADVVIVDLKEPDHLPEKGNVRYLVGDATHDETLLTAGLDRARGIAVATPSDAINIYLTLAARQLSDEVFIHVRATDRQSVAKAFRAGANRVIRPYKLTGASMAQSLLHPGASAFVHHATDHTSQAFSLMDITLPIDSPIRGPLTELPLRTRFQLTVVAIRKAGSDEMVHPHPESTVGPGDLLVLVGAPEDLARFQAHALTSGRVPPSNGSPAH